MSDDFWEQQEANMTDDGRSGLRCLSIKQPWASLIVHGHKDIENRTWRATYRGKVLIHAGKASDPDFNWSWAKYICPAIGSVHLGYKTNLGGIVGEAEIVDCVTEHPSPWFFGKYGFVLRNAKSLPFFPCRGALGFFAVPDGWADSGKVLLP